MAEDPELPRKRGRPPVEHKGSAATVWLSPRVHDQLITAARKREESISACLRRIVESKFKR